MPAYKNFYSKIRNVMTIFFNTHVSIPILNNYYFTPIFPKFHFFITTDNAYSGDF